MRTEMLIRMEGGSSEKGHAAKAMKVAAAMEGVESVTLSGKDKSLLRVVGDGVDRNHLTTRLRRKVGHADVVELRTLYAGAGAGSYYGYGSGSRAGGGSGSSLSRDAAAAAYGNGTCGGSSHYGGYGCAYPTAAAAASASAADDYYYGQQRQPSFQYSSYQPPPYQYAAPAGVHYEYYPSSAATTDPNGCSIM